MYVSKMLSVTVLVESSLEVMVCDKLRDWGAPGYIITRSQASGPIVARQEGAKVGRVRIEALVDKETASQILKGLQAESFGDRSLSFFVSEVVARSDSGAFEIAKKAERPVREERWGDYLITI